MSVDTIGRIRGYVSPERIISFLQQTDDIIKVRSSVKDYVHGKLSDLEYEYSMNPNGQNDGMCHRKFGYIDFKV